METKQAQDGGREGVLRGMAGANQDGGRGGGLLRYQVLLTLLALAVLGLGTGHVDVSGVRAVLQQVVEGIQVVGLDGGRERKTVTHVLSYQSRHACMHTRSQHGSNRG